MSNKTRKRLWPASLVMAVAIVGVLAAFLALGTSPTNTEAHDGASGPTHCDDLSGLLRDVHDDTQDHTCAEGQTESNDPPVATGSIDNVRLRINQRGDAIDVSGLFSDPDGDTLTYDADSSNTAVANAAIAGSMLTVVAGSIRGTATITVTADDGRNDPASISFVVTVAETYTLEASNPGDPMLPDPPEDDDTPDPYEDMRGIPPSAVYLVDEDEDGYPQEYDAHFSLGVAGSRDDVTVTITASEKLNITIVDSDGLIGAGFVDEEETDLEGSLTVKATDQGSRAFEIEGVCLSPGGWAHISVEDKDLDEVAEGAIYCKPAEEVVAPTDRFRSDMMTVVSYNDWDHWALYKTVSDGFIIVDNDTDKNVQHLVNRDHDADPPRNYHKDGILVRDEPVVESYRLAISPEERLTLKAGADPNRLTKAEAEEGQRTIEVMVGAEYVQLTVTSTMAGPAYIRFLDSNMNPFGTDVDEEPRWRGADVVGLDSQGHLALNLGRTLTKGEALAYDQYRVVIPGAADHYAYLDGLAGRYHQGAFRFMNPCPSELGSDHHFYVEVYEAGGKYHKTTEKVMCVVSPRPGPAGLEFGIDSDKPGEGRLTFKPARNAVGHTVLLIDAHNRNIVTSVTATAAMYNSTTNQYTVMFNNLNNGWTYHIVVLAEGAANQFTADAVKDYGVRWLGRADVPLSTTASMAPGEHDLCMVDDANITALLSLCDTASTELGMPTRVRATVSGSDVTVMWTNGANADRHGVFLFDANWDFGTRVASSQTDGTVTFRNVPSGSYTAVVAAVDAAFTDMEIGFTTVTVP